jgi:hypothetical protein
MSRNVTDAFVGKAWNIPDRVHRRQTDLVVVRCYCDVGIAIPLAPPARLRSSGMRSRWAMVGSTISRSAVG